MREDLLALVLLATLGVAPAAQAQSEADRWNLADIYPSQAAWDADAAKLDAQLRQFADCKGRLGASAADLRECLDRRGDLAKRASRLSVYASELVAEDTGAPASRALLQRAQLLETRVGETTAFVEPEILTIGARRIEQFLAADEGLGIHRYPLQRIVRRAAHTLDGDGEALLAKVKLMSDTGEAAYSILSNADIPWPRLKLASGEEITLDQSAYTKYRALPNRDDRKRVMEAFFGVFKTYERTMGVTLYGQMKQDKVFAELRRYPDSITAALDDNEVPVAVFDTLIAQTNANLSTLHRYFRLRAKLLGVQQLHYYDVYPPLVHGERFRFTLEQAKQLALDAVAPLGTEYAEAMRKGLDSRWMDAYPRPRKQSGAHAAAAYDVHPYVLMNFNGDYESVTTLAHEWGHAMHSHLANRAQPFATAPYRIFTAEIASTFNEALLLDRAIGAAKTDDERLYYLGSALEGLRATFFRQAMFGEFEREVHSRTDRGEPLTGDELSKTYCRILKRYHGDAVVIDDVDCVEWAYIPHFYDSFYVYQYATSIAASSLFVQQVIDKEQGARERYLSLLRAGGSDSPYLLVQRAGADLATPGPYQALVARMNRIMDDIDAILGQRK